jgi:hypothetical protein
MCVYLSINLLHGSRDINASMYLPHYMAAEMHMCVYVSIELLHGSGDTYAFMYLPHRMAAEMHVLRSLPELYSFVSNEAYSISKKKAKAYHYLPATVLQRKDACKLNWKKGGGGGAGSDSQNSIKRKFSKVSAPSTFTLESHYRQDF